MWERYDQTRILEHELRTHFILSSVLVFNPFKRVFMYLRQTVFENIVAKGEIPQNVQFPLLSKCFQ